MHNAFSASRILVALLWGMVVAGTPLTITTPRNVAQMNRGDLTFLRDAAGHILVTNRLSLQGMVLHRVEEDHRAGFEEGPGLLAIGGEVIRGCGGFAGLAGATVTNRYAVPLDAGDLTIAQQAVSPRDGLWGVEWSMGEIPLELNIIVPGNSGIRLTRASPGGTQTFDYPLGWEAQLVIIEGAGHGFYVWAEDPAGRFKRLSVTPTTQGWRLSFTTLNHAPFDRLRECVSVKWHVDTYEGDWRVPARRYREWAEARFHPVPVDQQRPAWVRETRGCVISGLELPLLDTLARHLDPRQTLLYVYDWRAAGYDRDYPTYDRPVPQLAPFVQRAHALGYRVMLHVNYFGCDPLNPLYAQFERYQVRSPWGQHEKEWWLWEYASPPIKFAYINPAHKPWRDLLVARLKTLVETTGVDALHLDQTLCIYNDHNGLIDGATMIEGNVALHRELRAALPEIALSGEGLNEVTCRFEAFAQRHASSGLILADGSWRVKRDGLRQAHPVSSYLLRPYTILYGYLGYPSPSEEQLYAAWNEAYQHWGVIPTLKPDPAALQTPGGFTRQLLDEARFFQQHRVDPDLDGPWPADVVFPFRTAANARATRTVDRRLLAGTNEISRTVTDTAEIRTAGTIPNAWQFDAERVWGLDPNQWYPVFAAPRDLLAPHITSAPADLRVTAVAERGRLALIQTAAADQVASSLASRLDSAVCASHPSAGPGFEVLGPMWAPDGAQFATDGERLLAHPPWKGSTGEAAARFSLDLPKAGSAWFRAEVAMDPGAVGPGKTDGVTFRVAATDGRQTLRTSTHNAATNHVALDLDLGPLAGQSIELTLAVHPGPAMNPSYDWARWYEPRIERMVSPALQEIEWFSTNRWALALSGTNEFPVTTRDGHQRLTALLPGEVYLATNTPPTANLPVDLARLSYQTFFLLSQGGVVNSSPYAGVTATDGVVGGVRRTGLFIHPPNGGTTTAAFLLRLPGEPAFFRTFVGLRDGSLSSGAGFVVGVNGAELARRELRPGKWEELLVDLAPWRERTMVLTLTVDALGGYDYDWGLWGEPRLQLAPRITGFEREPDGAAQVRVLGPLGLTCGLEASVDLIAWNRVAEAVFSQAPLELADRPAHLAAQRFYRAVLAAAR